MMEMVYITSAKLFGIAYHVEKAQFTKKYLREFFASRFLKTFSHPEIKALSALNLVLDAMHDAGLATKLVQEYKNPQETIRISRSHKDTDGKVTRKSFRSGKTTRRA